MFPLKSRLVRLQVWRKIEACEMSEDVASGLLQKSLSVLGGGGGRGRGRGSVCSKYDIPGINNYFPLGCRYSILFLLSSIFIIIFSPFFHRCGSVIWILKEFKKKFVLSQEGSGSKLADVPSFYLFLNCVIFILLSISITNNWSGIMCTWRWVTIMVSNSGMMCSIILVLIQTRD